MILTTENFEETVKNNPVVMAVFKAEAWCGPCKMFIPTFDRLVTKYNEEGKALIGKLEIDEHESVQVKYGVKKLPTMILFKDGNEVQRFEGGQGSKTLITAIDHAINGPEIEALEDF